VCSSSGEEEIPYCRYEKSWIFQLVFYEHQDHRWYNPLGLAGCLVRQDTRQENRIPGREEGRQSGRSEDRQEGRRDRR